MAKSLVTNTYHILQYSEDAWLDNTSDGDIIGVGWEEEEEDYESDGC